MDLFRKSTKSEWSANIRPKSVRGFTLVELLVVIAIIGILSSVVFASLNAARAKARDAKRISDLKQIQIALELYFDSQSPNAYPTNNAWWGNCSTFGSHGTTGANGWIPNLGGSQFLSVLPLDPKSFQPYGCYIYMSNGTDYKVMAYFTMESLGYKRCPSSCDLGTYPYCAELNDYALYSSSAGCW